MLFDSFFGGQGGSGSSGVIVENVGGLGRVLKEPFKRALERTLKGVFNRSLLGTRSRGPRTSAIFS